MLMGICNIKETIIHFFVKMIMRYISYLLHRLVDFFYIYTIHYTYLKYDE